MKTMPPNRVFPIFFAFFLVAFCAVAYCGNPELFKPKAGETSPSNKWELRKRLVETDLSLFRRPDGSPKKETVEERIVFNLFDDIVFTVVFTSVERSADARMTMWTGKIEGNDKSSITMAVSPDSVAGVVKTGSSIFYQIRPMIGGFQVIVEMNDSLMPKD